MAKKKKFTKRTLQQGKKKFRHESLQDKEMLRVMLQAMTDGIKNGEITFSDDKGDICMTPEGLMHFKLRASKKDGRNQFSFQVSWQDPIVATDQRPLLKVAAGE